MALTLLQLTLTRNRAPALTLTPVEDDSSHAAAGSHQVADSGASLRQSCSFAMHRAQQDPVIDGRTPPDWETNEFSTELWLARRWATYPQALSARSSDFAFVAFNQSLLCDMRKFVTIRREWTQQVVPFAESLGNSTPVVVANLLEHCPPPRQRPSNVLLLREVRRSPRWPMLLPTSTHVYPHRRERFHLPYASSGDARFARRPLCRLQPSMARAMALTGRGPLRCAVGGAQAALLWRARSQAQDLGGALSRVAAAARRATRHQPRAFALVRARDGVRGHAGARGAQLQQASGGASWEGDVPAGQCDAAGTPGPRLAHAARLTPHAARLRSRIPWTSVRHFLRFRSRQASTRVHHPPRGVGRRCCGPTRCFPATRTCAISSRTASASSSAATPTARPS